MPRNHRAVISTVLFAIIVALTGTLVLFLGSAAQADGRPAATKAPEMSKAPVAKAPVAKVKVKVPNPLAQVLASDAWPGDEFGWSVAVSGSTAVVGAPYADGYTGAAYVFSKVGSAWVQQAELIASDDATGDEFGWSVAVSGSTIAVGAPGHYYGIGAAYVFADVDGTWTQQGELKGADATGGDKFGFSVVTTGSQVMVGAKGHLSTGEVYVFAVSDGTWSQSQEFTSSDAGTSDMFGWSMTVSGTTLVVSAVKAHDDTGAVYVFTQSDGTWSQQAELTAGDGFANDYFGDKVAISGNRIVAGAPGHDTEQGAAYVFSGSGATWKQVDELTASDGEHNDCFGWAVGISGKTVLVGAEQTNADNGAAYVFKLKGGSKWNQQSELSDGDGGTGNEFGYSVSLSGTTAIISADQAEAGAGAAMLYKL